jgi:hypothetical protein
VNQFTPRGEDLDRYGTARARPPTLQRPGSAPLDPGFSRQHPPQSVWFVSLQWRRVGATTVPLNTARSRHGTSSLRLPGGSPADHYAITDHADFTLGAGDFTIEIQVRFNGAGGRPGVPLAVGPDLSNNRRAWALCRNAGGQLSLPVLDHRQQRGRGRRGVGAVPRHLTSRCAAQAARSACSSRTRRPASPS